MNMKEMTEGRLLCMTVLFFVPRFRVNVLAITVSLLLPDGLTSSYFGIVFMQNHS